MSIGFRRTLLVVLSLAFGVGMLFATFGLLNVIWGPGTAGFHNYDVVFVLFTIVPMAALAFIWLDYFLGTGILPEGPVEE